MMPHSEQIRIRGLVQGVGFRPAVWQSAQQLGVHGEVRNDGQGVLIIAQSSPQIIDQMLSNISINQPPLARIDDIERETIQIKKRFEAFSIKQSITNNVHTGFVADAATCELCLDDINDEDNRRHGYAFTNCTHCGPRLSIVNDLPYDRSNTSMSKFEQCPACQQEYQNPSDRRFHAQPNACPDCGPRLWLSDTDGDPIARTTTLIKQGFIIAIKGIGGFQLACDATNNEAVKVLRQRKHRPDKALALMAVSIAQIKSFCQVNKHEESLLTSASAPIVLLDKKESGLIAEGIAPGQNSLGFMLPYSPLHHLIMQQLDSPIVLTSGNTSEEPQCIDNDEAMDRLSTIADYFLLNNRDIVNRIDDSVVRSIRGKTHFLRRARGFAPSPILLSNDFTGAGNIFACGGELKNTFALMRDNQVTLSQHIGNLENAKSYDDYLCNIDLYRKLFQFDPNYIAVDKHPEYLSAKYGRLLSEELEIPCIEIQHHHAHIAACLAENGWRMDQGKVIGIALDGLGFGDDESIWGGEFLIADYSGFDRAAHLKPVAMPGGSQSILQPWRNTYAQLQSCFDWLTLSEKYADLELIQFLKTKPLNTFDQMILSDFNTPITSSCGRLFDAVAAAVGICRDKISYEGQAAIELESMVGKEVTEGLSPYPFEYIDGVINPTPMWRSLLNDLSNKTEFPIIAARFHLGLADIIVQTAVQISVQSNIKTVALSGGVFQNKTLFKLCFEQLQQNNLTVLFHQQIPANDGGLALGQAAIAAALLNQEKTLCV